MTNELEYLKKQYEQLQRELPVQQSLGTRATMLEENQEFLDARVLELRKPMALRFDEAFQAMLIAQASVSQASDALRKAIDAIKIEMAQNDCEGAAALGYKDLSSAYVFLQRTLGDLQSTGIARSRLITEIAGQVGYTFEEVAALLPESDWVLPRAKDGVDGN